MPVCSARSPYSFELHLKMKANLVHIVCPLWTAAVAYLLQAPSRASGLHFFSIVLYHAGMSIMYNLSYNTSRDSTSSGLHFDLMPLLSSCILCWLWSMYDPTKVRLCCVLQIDFDISGSHGEHITTQCLSPSLSLLLFRAAEHSVRLLKTRRPRFLLSPEASCSCIRWNSVINQIKMSCLLTAPPWIYGLLFQWIYCIIMYGYEYYMEPHTECMVRCLIAEFNY